MSYRVEADFENLPKGELVQVGFGIAVENGSSVEVDDEAAALFKEETGKTVHDAFSKSKQVKVTTSGTTISDKKGGDD